MQMSTSDFINLPALAKALAEQLKDSVGNGVAAKRVFNLDEAAEYCGLTRESFKKKVVRDQLRKVRLDKCWRFDKADLDAWIESHKEQIAQEVAA
jgi:excisionase family DNA binding protein